jgi:hypothetical protein
MVSWRQRTAFHEAGHCTAAIILGIPIIRVTIENDNPHLYRSRYSAQLDIGTERLVTMCLSGPASEKFFCGSIENGADRIDIEMARRYLSRRFDPWRIVAEIARLGDAAERLVRTAWVEQRIRVIADALLQYGTLSGEDICGVGDDPKRRGTLAAPQ